MRTRLARSRGHRWGAHACAALLAAAVLAGAPALGATPVDDAAHAERARMVVYLARRHWHVDVGFSVSDLGPSLAFIARRFPRARYLFFGFGDRHYLLSKRKGSSTLSGALIPGPGMILVTATENSPAQAFGAAQVLELSTADAAAAQSFVRRSLSGEEGATDIAPYADGPYEGSLYYSAVARYSALHTCNTWAAEALKSAGLPVRTTLVLFAGQIWNQARRIAARGGFLAPGYPRNPQSPRDLQSQGGGLPF